MAYKYNHECYVDAPRNGSGWTQEVLKRRFSALERVGGKHNFPPDPTPFRRVWTFLRAPDEWLRSLWAHRVRANWVAPQGYGPWHLLLNTVSRYASSDFEEFAIQTSKYVPGLITWFQDMIAPQWVERYHFRNREVHLREWYNVQDFPEPVNSSGFQEPIPQHIINHIYLANDKAWGWELL